MTEVMVVCAHSDDQIIGPGGTIAKLAKAGHKITTIILSYGILSHPHLKPEVIAEIRKQEAIAADKIIGGNGVKFVGVSEGQFLKESAHTEEFLKKEITNNKPKIIFTHTPDDPNADHRAVLKLVLRVYDELKPKADVLTFEIWNPISITTRNYPKVIHDISKTFDKKREALRAFKSQKVTMITMIWVVYLRAFFNGIRWKYKKAEVFYKIR